MNKKILTASIAAALLLSGCGKAGTAQQTAAPVMPEASPAAVETPAPAVTETPAPVQTVPQRQDGERFETTIILEGMEEKVRYEHIRNEALGFEMDYDYESFNRVRDADRERFISIYDTPENPADYLEVYASTDDAETAAAAIRAALSQDYEARQDSFQLERAGTCIRIHGDEVKGGGYMPEKLQMVYVIPAPDGCRIATEHYRIEDSEGFGRRFSYLMHTFSVLPR